MKSEEKKKGRTDYRQCRYRWRHEGSRLPIFEVECCKIKERLSLCQKECQKQLFAFKCMNGNKRNNGEKARPKYPKTELYKIQTIKTKIVRITIKIENLNDQSEWLSGKIVKELERIFNKLHRG